MLFNIINPSDPYTLEAPDLAIAAVAICLLGEGKYALEELGGDRSGYVPAFLMGGHDEWFIKQFGADFSAVVDRIVATRSDELSRALASVFIGNARDKRAFDSAAAECPDQDAFFELLHQTHDAKRTSVNDIGRRAWALADAVAAKAAEVAVEAGTVTTH